MFQIGDIVILKSGSPEMTVADVYNLVSVDGSSKHLIGCLYFNGDQLETVSFTVDCLYKVVKV